MSAPVAVAAKRRSAAFAGLAVVAAVAAVARPGSAQDPPPDPFAKQATCEGRVPGPEPGRTVLQICVPRLVRALAENGLVDVPEAKRLQPIVLGEMDFADAGGDPAVLSLDGGPRQLDGLVLANRSRTTIAGRVDIIYWNGRSATFLKGHRELRLRPNTRLRRRGVSTFRLISRGRVATLRLAPERIVEDP
jgi:hypothetical protein